MVLRAHSDCLSFWTKSFLDFSNFGVLGIFWNCYFLILYFSIFLKMPLWYFIFGFFENAFFLPRNFCLSTHSKSQGCHMGTFLEVLWEVPTECSMWGVNRKSTLRSTPWALSGAPPRAPWFPRAPPGAHPRAHRRAPPKISRLAPLWLADGISILFVSPLGKLRLALFTSFLSLLCVFSSFDESHCVVIAHFS